jgi:hypothetical protein
MLWKETWIKSLGLYFFSQLTSIASCKTVKLKFAIFNQFVLTSFDYSTRGTLTMIASNVTLRKPSEKKKQYVYIRTIQLTDRLCVK